MNYLGFSITSESDNSKFDMNHMMYSFDSYQLVKNEIGIFMPCMFLQVEITDVPADTKDKDEILESEFFDTRQAFVTSRPMSNHQPMKLLSKSGEKKRSEVECPRK